MLPFDRGIVRREREHRPWQHLGFVVAVAALIVSAMGGTVARAAVPASQAWSLVPSPSPPAPVTGDYRGVACPSSDRCLAVGDFDGNPGDNSGFHPFAARLEGTTLVAARVPEPPNRAGASGELLGVACPADDECFAVGTNDASFGALIERWDGSSWRVIASPTLPSGLETELAGVACPVRSQCFAVGSAVGGKPRALIERLRGGAWRLDAAAVPTGASMVVLSGIVCPTATACTAVGSYEQGGARRTLVERWNGSSWSLVPSPNPPGAVVTTLAGISCSTTTQCFAVGSSASSAKQYAREIPLIERWNGATWSIIAGANPRQNPQDTSALTSIACPSVKVCFAQGTVGVSPVTGQAAFAERWDGRTWSIIRRFGSTFPQLIGDAAISCASATSCVSVGGGNMERWNGSVWLGVPGGGSASKQSSVVCTSTVNCLAVGSDTAYHNFSNLDERPFFERWDGSHWEMLPQPKLPASSAVHFSGIACAASTRCFAVGFSIDFSRGRDVLAVVQWDGTGWSLMAIPDPDGDNSAELTSVACPTPTSCIAVGEVGDDFDHSRRSLVEQWDGTTWTATVSSDPSPVTLTGVACATATTCFAVGFDADHPVLDWWNGATLSMLTVANAPAVAAFSGVACPAADSCFAVGDRLDASDDSLIARWSGASWSVMPSPNPTGPGAHQLLGVSCGSISDCFAVGGAGDDPSGLPLAEHWDGTQWSIMSLAARPPGSTAVLSGVSCIGGPWCMAVGTLYTGLGQGKLAERFASS